MLRALLDAGADLVRLVSTTAVPRSYQKLERNNVR